MKTYRGTVHMEEAGAVLDAGGVKVRLEGDRERFAPLDGRLTTVVGEQDGDIIRNAAPALHPEAAAAAAEGTELFEPVIAAIKAHGDALRAVPGVFGVRPGFRTSDGEPTQEPAVIPHQGGGPRLQRLLAVERQLEPQQPTVDPTRLRTGLVQQRQPRVAHHHRG